MMQRATWFSACLLALFASACGGGSAGGLSAGDQELADNIRPKVADMGLLEDVDAEDVDCVAAALVARLGPARIRELDQQPEFILGADDAARSTDDYLKCVDVQQEFIDGMTSAGVSATSAKCTTDAMGKQLFRELVATGLHSSRDSQPPDELINPVADAARKCLTADEQKAFFGQ